MTSKAPPSNWKDLVAAKRNECKRKIPQDWLLSADQLALARETPHLLDVDIPRHSGLLSEVELDLTENYTANQILVKLTSGQVSSLAVTTAFCKRAAIAQQVVSTHLPDSKEVMILTHVLYRYHVSQRHSFPKHWIGLST